MREIVWHWEIPVYLFLGGLTAGLMIFGTLLGRREDASRTMRLLPLAVPVTLSLGMLALFLDLGQKLHVVHFYTSFRFTSPMSWGAWILVAVYPAAILLGLARLAGLEDVPFASQAKRLIDLLAIDGRRVRMLERVNLVLGVALGAYTGILLATLTARALWSSALLGPLFLVSGFSTAAALLMLLRVTREEHAAVRRMDVAAISIELVLLALLLAHLITSGARGRAAAELFLGGPYTAAFWSLVVIAGLGVPLAMELLESRRHLRATWAAPVLLLAGGFALRWIFVAAGQAG